MPIYDYRCRNCGAVAEVLVRRAEDSARCPGCGSEAMEKMVSASYHINVNTAPKGATCCGKAERCDVPSCSIGEHCRRK